MSSLNSGRMLADCSGSRCDQHDGRNLGMLAADDLRDGLRLHPLQCLDALTGLTGRHPIEQHVRLLLADGPEFSTRRTKSWDPPAIFALASATPMNLSSTTVHLARADTSLSSAHRDAQFLGLRAHRAASASWPRPARPGSSAGWRRAAYRRVRRVCQPSAETQSFTTCAARRGSCPTSVRAAANLPAQKLGASLIALPPCPEKAHAIAVKIAALDAAGGAPRRRFGPGISSRDAGPGMPLTNTSAPPTICFAS